MFITMAKFVYKLVSRMVVVKGEHSFVKAKPKIRLFFTKVQVAKLFFYGIDIRIVRFRFQSCPLPPTNHVSLLMVTLASYLG